MVTVAPATDNYLITGGTLKVDSATISQLATDLSRAHGGFAEVPQLVWALRQAASAAMAVVPSAGTALETALQDLESSVGGLRQLVAELGDFAARVRQAGFILARAEDDTGWAIAHMRMHVWLQTWGWDGRTSSGQAQLWGLGAVSLGPGGLGLILGTKGFSAPHRIGDEWVGPAERFGFTGDDFLHALAFGIAPLPTTMMSAEGGNPTGAIALAGAFVMETWGALLSGPKPHLQIMPTGAIGADNSHRRTELGAGVTLLRSGVAGVLLPGVVSVYLNSAAATNVLPVASLHATHATSTPQDAAAALQRISRLESNPAHGEVEILRHQGWASDGKPQVSWSVIIRGTQVWAPGATNPQDLLTNLFGVGGAGTDQELAVMGALRQVGVQPGEPIELVGHSQGAIVAGRLVSDPHFAREFDVRSALLAGGPTGSVRPATATTQVLVLENSCDPVPKLDGRAPTPHSQVTTVHFDSPAPKGAPFRAHDLKKYTQMAGTLETDPDPRLAQWRAAREAVVPRGQTPTGTTTSSWTFRTIRVFERK